MSFCDRLRRVASGVARSPIRAWFTWSHVRRRSRFVSVREYLGDGKRIQRAALVAGPGSRWAHGSRNGRSTGFLNARNSSHSRKCGLCMEITAAGIVRRVPTPFMRGRRESRERCGRGCRPPRASAKAQVTGLWRFCGAAVVFQRRPGGVSAARLRPGCSRCDRHAAVRMLCGHSQATAPPHGVHSRGIEWTLRG